MFGPNMFLLSIQYLNFVVLTVLSLAYSTVKRIYV